MMRFGRIVRHPSTWALFAFVLGWSLDHIFHNPDAGLPAELSKLQDRARSLAKKNAALKEAASMDRNAYTALESDLRDYQEEVAALRKEATFYRSIVSSGSNYKGLKIQSLELWPNDGLPGYRYRLILTHYQRNQRPVSGEVTFVVKGYQRDAPDKVITSQVTLSAGSESKFRFRSFKELRGLLTIPEGLTPLQLQAHAQVRGSHKEDDVFHISWADAIKS